MTQINWFTLRIINISTLKQSFDKSLFNLKKSNKLPKLEKR